MQVRRGRTRKMVQALGRVGSEGEVWQLKFFVLIMIDKQLRLAGGVLVREQG